MIFGKLTHLYLYQIVPILATFSLLRVWSICNAGHVLCVEKF